MTETFDITKHALVPEHRKLSDEEKQKMLERYNIILRQLPKILKSDPTLTNLDVKPGDLVEIKRKSETVGEALFYRVVVNG